MWKWKLPAVVLAVALGEGWFDHAAQASAYFDAIRPTWASAQPGPLAGDRAAEAPAAAPLPLSEGLILLPAPAAEAAVPAPAAPATAPASVESFAPPVASALGQALGYQVSVPTPMAPAPRALADSHRTDPPEQEPRIALPEPASILLLLTGLATAIVGLVARRYLRQRRTHWMGLDPA